MPSDIKERVIWGPDIHQPNRWARTRFCAWLAERLNDPDGPYAAALSLRVTPPYSADAPERRAIVTDNREIAGAMYSEALSPPVVFVKSGTEDDWRLSGKKIDGEFHHGKRYELDFTIDMGINDATPEEVDVVEEERDDALLADFVSSAIREGYDSLAQIGLNHAVQVPAGNTGGRHPRKLQFFVIALDEWAPPTP
ncbi:hypothetical protein EON80_15650 [bacterium]|nr:MAG: hypothetical protein EON80_15650 [bacterium]